MPNGPVDPQSLLSLALSRPAEALELARRVLTTDPDPDLAAAAHQAAGVVLRHFGAIDEAVLELRQALRWARRTGDGDRAADVASSLGVALAMAGQVRRGLRTLDAAVAASRGITRGRVLVRRSHVHWIAADYPAALRDAREAVRLLAPDDQLWRARAVNHRAMMYLALGDAARADRDYARSEELFTAAGQQFEFAYAHMERGLAAHARGDLPRALRLLDRTAVLFAEQGVVEPDLAAAQTLTLVSAGLSREALRVADAALAHLSATGGAPANRAVLLELAGSAAMADGDMAAAGDRSRQALALYRRQGNELGADRARLAVLTAAVEAARSPTGPDDPTGSTDPDTPAGRQRIGGAARRPTLSQAAQAVALAGRLAAHDGDLAARGQLVAARIALQHGRTSSALAALDAAAAVAGRSTGGRSVAWLARAMRHAVRGEHQATLRACAAGLRVIETHLRSLGALELRSVTTAQGAELAGLAIRTALQRRRPDLVLGWVERWRSVALAVPPVQPDDDAQLAADLTALRVVTRRLTVDDSPPLQRERRRLESSVRARIHAVSGPGGPVGGTARAADVVAEVAASQGRLELLELFLTDGQLHAVHVQGRRIRLHHIGSHAQASRVLEHALFLLRREASGRGQLRMDLHAVGVRLQEALLGDAADAVRAPELVVVPPGPLHSVPWALFPALRDRAVVVAPSATSWLRARAAPEPAGRRVVLVSGPNLPGGAGEVAALARRYPDAVVLTADAATSAATLTQMDGAALVHLAAHGTFRSDSPLFSAIELADGPLTAYDLERLHRAPQRMLLSSCSSAVGAPTGADELLGVVSSLIARGCTGVVGSVVPVSDPGTVPLMVAVHENLARGMSLPRALHGAVRTTVADQGSPLLRAAAGSFIAMGA